MYNRKRLGPEDIDQMRINLSVMEKKLNSEPSCDFCGEQPPVYVYAAERMSTGEWTKNWRWCACQDCSDCIEADRWKEIELKIIKWAKKKFPRSPMAVLETVADISLLEFFKYVEKIDLDEED